MNINTVWETDTMKKILQDYKDAVLAQLFNNTPFYHINGPVKTSEYDPALGKALDWYLEHK